MKKPYVLIPAFAAMLLMSSYASAYGGHHRPNQHSNAGNCPQCAVNKHYRPNNPHHVYPNSPSAQYNQLRQDYIEKNRFKTHQQYRNAYSNQHPHYSYNQRGHYNRR